jgi:hypothetical protein
VLNSIAVHFEKTRVLKARHLCKGYAIIKDLPMTTDYPKKYWWIVLIVVPIVVAIIGLLDFTKKKEKGDGDIVFNNIDVVIEQVGHSISEEALNELNNTLRQAMDLVESKKYSEALPLFESAAKVAPVSALKENIKNAKIALAELEKTPEVPDNNEVLTNVDAKWQMIQNPERIELGRIVVEVPEDAETYVAIFKAGEEGKLEDSYKSRAFDLLPGLYDVKIHIGAIVESVPVRKHTDTRIRMGLFSITTDSYWAIFDEEKEVKIFDAYSGKKISLPVGQFSLKVGNVFTPITVNDEQTTQY